MKQPRRPLAQPPAGSLAAILQNAVPQPSPRVKASILTATLAQMQAAPVALLPRKLTVGIALRDINLPPSPPHTLLSALPHAPVHTSL